jgi:hypothetical protein
MEARASLGRTGISKGFIVAIAVSVTLGLGVMAAAVAKNVSGSSTTQTHAVKAQPASAPTYAQQGYRGGKQTLDDSLAPAGTSVAPRDSRSVGGHGPIE